MSKVSLATIKSWFQARMKPTQIQFENTFDSFRHKDDVVPLGEVNGLIDLLNGKAATAALAGKADLIDGKVPVSQLPATAIATWGNIQGVISEQADLQNVLDAKCNNDIVGDLLDLQTDNKGSIVGAINELDNGISNIQTDNITVSIYKISNFGTL